MSQLPKIVRDRLAGAPAAAVQSSHPDPDMLTAFIEGAVSERERQQLLAHLAACADCREVVALSTPELVAEPELQVAAASSNRRKWWDVTALRWATVSATAVIVVAAVLLTRPSPKSQSVYNRPRITSDAGLAASLAKSEAREDSARALPKQAADQKSATALYAPSMIAPADELRDKLETKKTATPKPASSAPQQQIATVEERASSAVHSNLAVTARRARTSADTKPAGSNAVGQVAGAAVGGVAGGAFRTAPAAPSIPAAPSKVTAANQSAADMNQTQLQAQTREVVTTQVANVGNQKKDELKLSDQATASQVPNPAPAKPATQAGGGVGPASGTGAGVSGFAGTGARSAAEVMATPTNMVKAKLPLYRWTIDRTGKLERSGDGKTWEVVPVADGAKLQSLAVVEQEIWTGGAVGLLYHSDDGGNRWTRVRPAVGDTVLSDDITRITLPNPQQVMLTTASAQQWLSSDGGRTWHKQ